MTAGTIGRGSVRRSYRLTRSRPRAKYTSRTMTSTNNITCQTAMSYLLWFLPRTRVTMSSVPLFSIGHAS